MEIQHPTGGGRESRSRCSGRRQRPQAFFFSGMGSTSALFAGALSMAAGEYVSVSSQRDAERADIRLEELELRNDPQGELREPVAKR